MSGAKVRLSARERSVLVLLAKIEVGEWLDGPTIARGIRAHPQGAHQTVTSLLRKGLVRKARHLQQEKVLVQITDFGRELAGSGVGS